MIKYVFCDLDGTLLDMNQEVFTKQYFGALAKQMIPFGFKPEDLVAGIKYGTKAMILNDGNKTNETVFWENFSKVMGQDMKQHLPIFDKFYQEIFDSLSVFCKTFDDVVDGIKTLKHLGLKLVIASNPLFPILAMEKRLAWAGGNKEDFEFITSYETSFHSKPNPLFFKEIADRLNVLPSECIMVGNDEIEDMAAAKIGMNVFLINRTNTENLNFQNGNFNDFVEYVQKLNQK